MNVIDMIFVIYGFLTNQISGLYVIYVIHVIHVILCGL